MEKVAIIKKLARVGRTAAYIDIDPNRTGIMPDCCQAVQGVC